MRKTRLVIQTTRCLHTFGFLLLYVSCPIMGDWGLVQPETAMSHRAIALDREGTRTMMKGPPPALSMACPDGYSCRHGDQWYTKFDERNDRQRLDKPEQRSIRAEARSYEQRDSNRRETDRQVNRLNIRREARLDISRRDTKDTNRAQSRRFDGQRNMIRRKQNIDNRFDSGRQERFDSEKRNEVDASRRTAYNHVNRAEGKDPIVFRRNDRMHSRRLVRSDNDVQANRADSRRDTITRAETTRRDARETFSAENGRESARTEIRRSVRSASKDGARRRADSRSDDLRRSENARHLVRESTNLETRLQNDARRESAINARRNTRRELNRSVHVNDYVNSARAEIRRDALRESETVRRTVREPISPENRRENENRREVRHTRRNTGIESMMRYDGVNAIRTRSNLRQDSLTQSQISRRNVRENLSNEQHQEDEVRFTGRVSRVDSHRLLRSRSDALKHYPAQSRIVSRQDALKQIETSRRNVRVNTRNEQRRENEVGLARRDSRRLVRYERDAAESHRIDMNSRNDNLRRSETISRAAERRGSTENRQEWIAATRSRSDSEGVESHRMRTDTRRITRGLGNKINLSRDKQSTRRDTSTESNTDRRVLVNNEVAETRSRNAGLREGNNVRRQKGEDITRTRREQPHRHVRDDLAPVTSQRTVDLRHETSRDRDGREIISTRTRRDVSATTERRDSRDGISRISLRRSADTRRELTEGSRLDRESTMTRRNIAHDRRDHRDDVKRTSSQRSADRSENENRQDRELSSMKVRKNVARDSRVDSRTRMLGEHRESEVRQRKDDGTTELRRETGTLRRMERTAESSTVRRVSRSLERSPVREVTRGHEEPGRRTTHNLQRNDMRRTSDVQKSERRTVSTPNDRREHERFQDSSDLDVLHRSRFQSSERLISKAGKVGNPVRREIKSGIPRLVRTEQIRRDEKDGRHLAVLAAVREMQTGQRGHEFGLKPYSRLMVEKIFDAGIDKWGNFKELATNCFVGAIVLYMTTRTAKVAY